MLTYGVIITAYVPVVLLCNDIRYLEAKSSQYIRGSYSVRQNTFTFGCINSGLFSRFRRLVQLYSLLVYCAAKRISANWYYLQGARLEFALGLPKE